MQPKTTGYELSLASSHPSLELKHWDRSTTVHSDIYTHFKGALCRCRSWTNLNKSLTDEWTRDFPLRQPLTCFCSLAGEHTYISLPLPTPKKHRDQESGTSHRQMAIPVLNELWLPASFSSPRPFGITPFICRDCQLLSPGLLSWPSFYSLLVPECGGWTGLIKVLALSCFNSRKS